MKESSKDHILDQVSRYYTEEYGTKEPWVPGVTRIPYAGRVFDEKELRYLVDASLEFWLTAGRYTDKFEKELASFLGVRFCSLVNSGSSANLLAFMALTSDKLNKRKIRRQDEVITVAAGFPTTVAPILQYGAVPVFIDVELSTYNVDITHLEAVVSDKTKAVVLAHTLGNPFNISAVKEFCQSHDLWLIEDNCDALGSRYNNIYTGNFGDIATSSFYPAHHITMGEGGAVYTNNKQLHDIVRSLRDWGRDCMCPSGQDNSCGRRFNQRWGELPFGYDHKYIYSHFGYNLKATDLQAAIGCAQLEKLPYFIDTRKHNWNLLRSGLLDLEEYFILPQATQNSDPSWFGFPLTVRNGTSVTRDKLVSHLESKGIQTRMLFAGNLLKHPCFDRLRARGNGYKVGSCLDNTNTVMTNTLWLGVYPGLTEAMVEFVINQIQEYVAK